MKISPIVAAFGLVIATAAPGIAAEGPAGEWQTQDGSAVVKISKCGGGFCGFVVKGQPGKDYRNPDPRKRNRSVIGIQVFFNMKSSGPASWSGPTYNAEDGQMYSGKISVAGPATLVVEGCVPGGGACGSQSWARVR